MPERQKKKLFAALAVIVLLLSFPFIAEMHYLPVYYLMLAGIGIWLLGEAVFHNKLEERFYQRWEKIRQWSFNMQLARSVTLYFVFITSMIFLGRLFANGTPPAALINAMETTDLLLYSVILVAITGYMGSSGVRQNEKKYQMMREEKGLPETEQESRNQVSS